MKRLVVLGLLAGLFASSASGQGANPSLRTDSSKPEKETRYLAFQIFTYGPDPRIPTMGERPNSVAKFPDEATLRAYILDIKQRIGIVGDPRNRLAVVLGHLAFDHPDAEVVKFIEMGFRLALETDVAVGFHIDDSMFWAKRKDLWSDPKNVEALDWEGTPCTGRRLDWQTGPGAKPDAAPPQMCFNSKVIQRETRNRAGLIGKAIQSGVKQLQELHRPELFAGVIAGSETMIGRDFQTGRYLGYRALMNRGFSREHPPKDLNRERESIIQEFIGLWTGALADAGVSPRKIYSHIAFFPRRAFKISGNAEDSYSEHNHFTPPPVAFGSHHRPGFSTYPAPGLFDDIHEELARHQQEGWASCEGTNLQLGSGPGQSGMNMETYLAKMFNHGGTLVNIFSWGIGGEAHKNMDFRVVTEGEEALRAYRKFLRGEPLVEAKTEALTLLERLPPKIRRIQKDLPTWLPKAGSPAKAAEARALMQSLETHLKAKDFDRVEKVADSLLKLMGLNAESVVQEVVGKGSATSYKDRLPAKIQKIQKTLPGWIQKTGNVGKAAPLMKRLGDHLKANNFEEAEKTADSILKMIGENAPEADSRTPEEVRNKLVHELGSAFLVFREKVQVELKLTPEQQDKLETRLKKLLPEAIEVLQKIEGLDRSAREKAVRAYRESMGEKLAAVPKETLNEGQRVRLRQLETQREGLFGAGGIWDELKLTQAQRKQFVAAIQQAQKPIESLLDSAQKGGNPNEIRPKVLKLRAELQHRLEDVLTDEQKAQWKAMVGKPADLGVLFDLSSRSRRHPRIA